jgi:SPP1 family phage portal protein
MQATETLILQCLNELNQAVLTKQTYSNYYNGDHAILKDYAMQESRSNRKLIFNYPRKFVDNEVGYILGKPVNYISKSDKDEVVHKLDLNMSHWEKEHNINLRKQSEIFGESYELNYIDSEGQFASTVLTPLNAYVLEDGTVDRNVNMAIHKFKKPFDDRVYLDVYTNTQILHYLILNETQGLMNSKSKPSELFYYGVHNHIFGRVPIISCPANTERKCGFQDVISLFDAYNALNSDLVNEIADHRNSYLVIENAKLEEEDLLKMKKMGIIQVPVGGKVTWLIKEINDSFVKNELDNLEHKIYDMMDQVNFNENWASNTSSLALRNKLLNLENRVAIREAMMEKVIKNRLRNFFTYLQKKEGVQYDYRDIAVKFTRNLPTDLVGLADVIVKLQQVCSKETLLTLLPFVENPKLELNKYLAEQQRLADGTGDSTNAK